MRLTERELKRWGKPVTWPEAEQMYREGKLAPHYPVPALVTKLQPFKGGMGLIVRRRDRWRWMAEGC